MESHQRGRLSATTVSALNQTSRPLCRISHFFTREGTAPPLLLPSVPQRVPGGAFLLLYCVLMVRVYCARTKSRMQRTQIVGRPLGEGAMLRVAHALEGRLDFASHVPERVRESRPLAY